MLTPALNPAKALLFRAKRRVTEQINVVLILIVVHAFASVYGWIEGEIYPYYPFKGRLEVFGHFTYYHVAMLSLFFLASFSIALSRVMISYKKSYVFLAAIGSMFWGFWVEDMVYFAQRYPEEMLGPDSWVNWILSGHYVLGHWIPTMYYLLAIGGFSLYAVAFVRSSKDSVLAFARMRSAQSKGMVQPFKFVSRINEFKTCMLSIGPFILLTIPITMLATFLKDWGTLPSNLSRIVAAAIGAFTPSLVMLFASARGYMKVSLEASFRSLISQM
jgi:hypothetical protein